MDDLLWNSLDLLGFAHDHSRKIINEDIFLEAMYFLLTIWSKKYKQLFRHCWPITVKTKNDYKKTLQIELGKLEKEHLLPLGSSQPSRVNCSVLHRSVELLQHMCILVLRSLTDADIANSEHQPNYHEINKHANPMIDSTSIDMMKIHMSLRLSHLRSRISNAQMCEKEWQKRATSLLSSVDLIHKMTDERNMHLSSLPPVTSPLNCCAERVANISMLHTVAVQTRQLGERGVETITSLSKSNEMHSKSARARMHSIKQVLEPELGDHIEKYVFKQEESLTTLLTTCEDTLGFLKTLNHQLQIMVDTGNLTSPHQL